MASVCLGALVEIWPIRSTGPSAAHEGRQVTRLSGRKKIKQGGTLISDSGNGERRTENESSPSSSGPAEPLQVVHIYVGKTREAPGMRVPNELTTSPCPIGRVGGDDSLISTKMSATGCTACPNGVIYM